MTTTYMPVTATNMSYRWVEDETVLKERSERLREVAEKYRTPEPEQIQTLRKGRSDLRYTSHATVTQILNEVDPLWQFEFVTNAGVPVTIEKNGMLTAFCHLTLLGKRIFGVASCEASKGDWAKELYGDGIRNCCMRAGIHIALWDKDFPEAEKKEQEAKQKRGAEELRASAKSAKEQFAADLASVRKVAAKQESTVQSAIEAGAAVNRLLSGQPEPSGLDEFAPKEPLAPAPDVGSASRAEALVTDPLEEASELVQEELGATLATPLCGTQPERFAQWPPVPGCGNQVEEVDQKVVRLTKTYLCNDCLGKWRASTGAKEEQ